MIRNVRTRWKRRYSEPGRIKPSDISGLPDRDRQELGLPPKVVVSLIYDLKV